MDVIVVGLGAMGSAAAQHLAGRGHRVLGFDQFAPPHTWGSSHGKTRIFRQAYFEDLRYVPLLMRSYELWQKLERDSGSSLLHLSGALVVGPKTGELVARSVQSASQFGLPHELLHAKTIAQRYPAIYTTPDTAAVLERNAGYLLAERCVEQQIRLAVHAGAQIHTDEAVLAWTANSQTSTVNVQTHRGSYHAERLVITAGPWAPKVLADLDLPLAVTRQVLYWFEPKGSMDLFRPDRLPVYVIEAKPGYRHVYGFPLTGPVSEGVKVAVHGSDDLCTPDTVDRALLPEDEQIMRKRLADALPDLAGRLLRSEVCLYTMTPDEHFLIGQHPQHSPVTLAAGFSGHGFKFAPVIGEILADLAGDGRSRHDLDLFSLDRFKTVQQP